MCDGPLDDALNLFGPAHVARLKMAGPRSGRGQLRGERAAGFLVDVANNDICAGAHEDACAARADALAAAGDQRRFVEICRKWGCVLCHRVHPAWGEWLLGSAHWR